MGPTRDSILVVDDEAFIRDLARTALESAGYHVLLAADGEEAVDVVGRHVGRIALVVLDLIMPRMAGWESLGRMRAIDPSIRALISTGYAEEPAPPHPAGGVAGVMLKPYRPRELVEAVRGALARVAARP